MYTSTCIFSTNGCFPNNFRNLDFFCAHSEQSLNPGNTFLRESAICFKQTTFFFFCVHPIWLLDMFQTMGNQKKVRCDIFYSSQTARLAAPTQFGRARHLHFPKDDAFQIQTQQNMSFNPEPTILAQNLIKIYSRAKILDTKVPLWTFRKQDNFLHQKNTAFDSLCYLKQSLAI